jgi:rSAM/selenodomain-associated transferase 1
VDVHLYFAPPLPEEPLSDIPDDVTVATQEGEELGARMKNAVRETLEKGYDRTAVIGSDHPTLPIGFVRQSFAALEPRRSVCIGPSEDGGFYLLGMNAYYPELFEGMTYSHDSVFTDTLARVAVTDARLTVLPQWYDVDTPAMLERMVTDLEHSDVKAAHTRQMVEDLDLHALPKS